MKKLLLQNIKARYNKKEILHDISIKISQKQILLLMGTSGSGKTTLLLTILGIIPITNGKIILNDRDITNLPIEQRNIGYLPQDYGLFTHLNVFDNVSYGLKVRSIPTQELETRTKQMLELVDLKRFEKRKIKELSGGQKQRVGLARALAIKPDLLLLDEPMSNIDQITKFDVAKQLKKLLEKLEIPTILVTHNHEDARFFAKQVAIMIEGKIVQKGAFNTVLKTPKNKLVKKLLMPL